METLIKFPLSCCLPAFSTQTSSKSPNPRCPYKESSVSPAVTAVHYFTNRTTWARNGS